jgi:nitroreductase
MDFFALIHARRSVRTYQKRPVERKQLDQILEAANQAPSAGNLQAYSILVVHQRELRVALSRAALNQESLVQAPVVLAFLARPRVSAVKYSQRGMALYAVQDATIACAYAQLAAVDLGLASVWIGAFEEPEVKRILKVAEEDRPVALLPIGYPAESPPPTPRRLLAELVKDAV